MGTVFEGRGKLDRRYLLLVLVYIGLAIGYWWIDAGLWSIVFVVLAAYVDFTGRKAAELRSPWKTWHLLVVAYFATVLFAKGIEKTDAEKRAFDVLPAVMKRDPVKVETALSKVRSYSVVKNLEWDAEAGLVTVTLDHPGKRRDDYAEAVCRDFRKAGADTGISVIVLGIRPGGFPEPVGHAICALLRDR